MLSIWFESGRHTFEDWPHTEDELEYGTYNSIPLMAHYPTKYSLNLVAHGFSWAVCYSQNCRQIPKSYKPQQVDGKPDVGIVPVPPSTRRTLSVNIKRPVRQHLNNITKYCTFGCLPPRRLSGVCSLNQGTQH